jgi:valyl-tRNA synthetase
MIMMGLKFTDQVPFREVYIHGLVRDHDGQKMSKSKGNTLDPLDLIDGIDLESLVAKRTEALMNPDQKPAIEKITRTEFPDGIPAYGTDALRMSFTSLATLGRDVRFDLGRIEGYHKFCNKLWNASQYVFAQLTEPEGGGVEFSVADRWIKAKLRDCIAETRSCFENYRFDLATQAIYEFTWHEFCDWYLELTKPVLNGEDIHPELKKGARETLSEVIGALYRLAHPIIPFVTEELWLGLMGKLGQDSDSIMQERFPATGDFVADAQACAEIEWLKSFIVGVRKIRGEMNLSPSRPLPVKLEGHSDLDRQRVDAMRIYIDRLARVDSVEWLAPGEQAPGAATELLGEMRILIPLAGLIDAAKEIERLEKQLFKLARDLDQTEKKLNNARFVANAPADVVAKERDRADELATRRNQLQNQREKLREIA